MANEISRAAKEFAVSQHTCDTGDYADAVALYDALGAGFSFYEHKVTLWYVYEDYPPEDVVEFIINMAESFQKALEAAQRGK